MNNYIATFFSHYDALTFFSLLKEQGLAGKLIPVPRKVSASCGTCVSYESNEFTSDIEFISASQECEIEAIYIETDGKFTVIWVNDGD